MRQMLKDNPIPTVAVCAGVLAVCGVLLMRGGSSGEGVGPPKQWFYDTVTEELFAHPLGMRSPITNAAGNPSVRARIFTCGTCTAEDRFVGYYQKFSDEAQEKLRTNPTDIQAQRTGMLFSADAKEWHLAGSTEALQLQQSVQEKCPDGSPRECQPGDA